MTAKQAARRRRILRCVAEIPRGNVTTYGCVGHAVGTGPRQVAAVLALDPGAADVPWHRVVGAGGVLRILNPLGHQEQRERLTAEGLDVGERRVKSFDAAFLDVSELR